MSWSVGADINMGDLTTLEAANTILKQNGRFGSYLIKKSTRSFCYLQLKVLLQERNR